MPFIITPKSLQPLTGTPPTLHPEPKTEHFEPYIIPKVPNHQQKQRQAVKTL